MARWDKVNSEVGVHRIHQKNDVNVNDFDKLCAVGVDANGLGLLKQPGQSGFVGVTIPNRTVRKAGDRIDIFDLGEAVECAGLAAGRKYYVDPASGAISTTRSAIYLGYTVEADRLIVQFDGKADA